MKPCKDCGIYPVDYGFIDFAVYYYQCPKCGKMTNKYMSIEQAEWDWDFINREVK